MAFFQNIPVIGRYLGGGGEEVKTEAPSFPDYMLDPDAVVSLSSFVLINQKMLPTLD